MRQMCAQVALMVIMVVHRLRLRVLKKDKVQNEGLMVILNHSH